MTRELVSKWFDRLAEKERDLPLLMVDSAIYTPRTAYNEVMRASPIGSKLQALIETGRFGTSTYEEEQIAKIRLRQILQTQPEKPLFATLRGKVFTPSELLGEIESNTDVGRQWLSNEIEHMKRIVSVR